MEGELRQEGGVAYLNLDAVEVPSLRFAHLGVPLYKDLYCKDQCIP